MMPMSASETRADYKQRKTLASGVENDWFRDLISRARVAWHKSPSGVRFGHDVGRNMLVLSSLIVLSANICLSHGGDTLSQVSTLAVMQNSNVRKPVNSIVDLLDDVAESRPNSRVSCGRFPPFPSAQDQKWRGCYNGAEMSTGSSAYDECHVRNAKETLRGYADCPPQEHLDASSEAANGQARRHDLRADSDVTFMDDANTFKKSVQVVGRPPVTEKNINDEYIKNPPKRTLVMRRLHKFATYRKLPGKKEGAFDLEDTGEEGILGEQSLGKYTNEAALGDMVNEDTVHSNS
ncbi:hypothetical protein NM688_g4915 [Phlebia brevispora]|uniref:Uncharacterized protein n=1 Tax=Phlebia brevispora TaxID=194682 RepID=A0ACC1T1R8_9APHY|nr:hypothetical protein NM688_g4915 [Phlebia brevispora]